MSEEGNDNADLPGAVALGDRVFCPMNRPVLHHVSLVVSDMEASSRFYTEGLGPSLQEEFDDIIGLRGANRFPFTVASVFLEAGEGR
ncbi:MAG: VOC family protein [Pseudomonadota bacterium]